MEPALSEIYYVVRKGDNLADLAKKFYGPKEGNKRANIKRIFEANRGLLDSPDEIYPGQKLIIPPLWASAPDKNDNEKIFPDSMFEKVASIGRRHF
jgi:LysM repeat protein